MVPTQSVAPPLERPMGRALVWCQRYSPSVLGNLTVIGMDGVKPTQAQTVLPFEAGKSDPLRAGPGPRPVAKSAENKLRNVGGKETETLLRLAQAVLGQMGLGQIAQYLDEPSAVLERHHQAGGKEG